ncbi:MAG: hypothetical protein ABIQ31_03235 [Ferruginibacter sp.]
MEDVEIINLWKSYDKKLAESLLLNRRNTEDITKIKIRSFLASMRPMKIFNILAGIVWVVFVDTLIIKLFPYANFFFLFSAIIHVLLTKLAIGIYLYQLILIYLVDISEPVLATQDKLARLRSSTLWVARFLFAQLPLWTTFYWNKSMLDNGNAFLYTIQIIVTLFFTLMAVWLFRNTRYENRDKKWFRLIFNGIEWQPLIKSMELLSQVDEYKIEK